jgi:hypothetical protein
MNEPRTLPIVVEFDSIEFDMFVELNIGDVSVRSVETFVDVNDDVGDDVFVDGITKEQLIDGGVVG